MKHPSNPVQAYSAFSQRNVDSALALMSENVSWPKASEGGRVVGKEEIRAYWTRQWQEFDPQSSALGRNPARSNQTGIQEQASDVWRPFPS
jgi:hypothetical protein